MSTYEANQKLFKSTVYSDIRITCDGETFIPAHRAVIGPQSPGLHTMMTNTKNGILRLIDDNEADILRLLSVLYKGNYDDPIYGDKQPPCTIALLSSKDIKNFLGKSLDWPMEHFRDQKDDKALWDAESRVLRDGLKWQDNILFSMSNALSLLVLAIKYQVTVAQALTTQRLWRAFEMVLSEGYREGNRGDVNFVYEGLCDIVRDLYNWTTPQATLGIRSSIISFIVDHVQNFGPLLTTLLRDAVQQNPDLAEDLRAAGVNGVDVLPSPTKRRRTCGAASSSTALKKFKGAM